MVEDFNDIETAESAKRRAVKILSESGIENPQIDVTAMLKHILHCDEIYLVTHRNVPLPRKALKTLGNFVSLRKKKTPLAYILGEKEFMSLKFSVNENTLIPRPDTEIVTEEVIALTKKGDSILDLCTGSGAIGISCAKYTQAKKVLCVDKFEKTLETAQKNALFNKVAEKCFFLNCDVLTSLGDIGEKFDIVVSNPPYIQSKKIALLEENVKDFEPITALDGGNDGLVFYKKIIGNISCILKKGGILAFEIGYDQNEAVTEIMQEKFYGVYTKYDLGKNARAIIGYLR